MPAFQLLRCKIALAGDREQVVFRHRSDPIVYPELIVLQHLHGDDAVTDIAAVGTWNTSYGQVVDHLNVIYGETAFKAVYPGARPNLPLGDPTIPPCTRPVYEAKPTLPDRPGPIITPLGQFALQDKDAPRVVHAAPRTADPVTPYEDPPATLVEEPPADVPVSPLADPEPIDETEAPADRELSEAEIDKEMADIFGEAVIRQETDDELINREIQAGMAYEVQKHEERKAAAKALKAAAGAIRPQQDKVRGRLASSPRTADHTPDVAGGNRRPLADKQMRAAAGESRYG